MFWPSRIQRYILRECLSGLAIVLGIFLLAILMIDIVEQLRTVGGDVNLTLGGALRLSLMKLPLLLEQTLPFALLAASMMAFTRLNRRSELSIIRASGLSAWRFLMPVMLLGLALGLFSAMLLNPFATRLNQSFEAERARILNVGRTPMAVADSGVWLRQGDDASQFVIHARRVEDGGRTLLNVKMIEEQRLYLGRQPTNDFAFVRRIDAERAVLNNGFWQLENLVENLPNQMPERRETLAIPTSLDAATLLDEFASPNTIGFWGLPRFIRETRDAGLDTSRYTMRWYGLTATPALFVAMALIGALACLRLQRLGGTSRLLATGVLAAIGLYFFTQFSSSLGATGAAPPVVAAWSPPLFVLFACFAFIAYREDG
ncbi:LPS export ABC transporter permease LptG [Hyphomonas sp.]|uniref:LPS export ABC transporter permease LptG n=1 Tax=Hyphomonas sp. TaxID=87 RepID=UPI00391880D3